MDAALDFAAAKCGLAGEMLRSFRMVCNRATGSSMLPAIRPDDVLWFRDSKATHPGDRFLLLQFEGLQ